MINESLKKKFKATREDLFIVMPSRNTVMRTVNQVASEKKQNIGKLLKEAILVGGIACTTDTWTDDHLHRTYICLVAHLMV